jgi:hypothetical protein
MLQPAAFGTRFRSCFAEAFRNVFFRSFDIRDSSLRGEERSGPDLARSGMNAEEKLTLEFVVAESDVAAFGADAAAAGGNLLAAEPFEPRADEADAYGDRQFEPLTIVAVAAGVAFVVSRISDVWLDHTRPGGQIVDLRTTPAQVRPAPHLDRGELLVIRDDGRESYYAKSRDQSAAILREVLGAGRA